MFEDFEPGHFRLTLRIPFTQRRSRHLRITRLFFSQSKINNRHSSIVNQIPLTSSAPPPPFTTSAIDLRTSPTRLRW